MTLMPEVPRLWLHAYVRVCSTELQLQTFTKFFNNSKYDFLSAGYGTDNGPDTV